MRVVAARPKVLLASQRPRWSLLVAKAVAKTADTLLLIPRQESIQTHLNPYLKLIGVVC